MQNFPALMRWQIGLLHWLFSHKADFEIIHACDFDTIIPSILVKLILKKKMVYDIFDFYADYLSGTPNWIKRLISNFDLGIIGKANAVILVDDSRRLQIVGSNSRQLSIIYNIPEETIPKQELNGKITPLHDPGLIIVYVGLLQRERGLFEMLEVVRKSDRWYLHIAGFGGDEAEIKTAAAQMENIQWHGRIPYEQAMELSANADVLFVTYDPAVENRRYPSPNKVFEAMMLGKPIIVARNTNLDRTLIEEECGLAVNFGKVEEPEYALENFAFNPEFRHCLGQNARKAYETRYSWCNERAINGSI